MSKGGGRQTVTTQPDAATQAYVNFMRRIAMGYVSPSGAPEYAAQGLRGGPGRLPGQPGYGMGGAGGGPILPGSNPALEAAQAQYGQYANAGGLGLSALTGGANPFMNTYLTQMDPFFARQRAMAVNAANDQATQAGAFGGDRSGIAAAEAGNLADQNQAQFNFQAFNDAQQRALALANLGFGSQAQAAFLPQQYAAGQLGLLNQAMGPYGETQSQPLYRNRFGSAVGGAATGGELFGPYGALAGGLGGLLFG